METIVGIVSLLLIVSCGLIVTRIATVALMFTGLSRELARFQARSAFTGCGFTTSEAEQLVQHPVRRRIVMLLMLLGNGTIVLAISALIPVFLGGSEHSTESRLLGVLWMLVGLALLWAAARSKTLERNMERLIRWTLRRWTRLEIIDFPSLLQLSRGYSVAETPIGPNSWLAGQRLIDLRLGDEGMQVLGIRRSNGDYIGAPTGRTYIRKGDTLLLYGKQDALADVSQRQRGPAGDKAHATRVAAQRSIVEEETRRDVRPAGANAAGPGEE